MRDKRRQILSFRVRRSHLLLRRNERLNEVDRVVTETHTERLQLGQSSMSAGEAKRRWTKRRTCPAPLRSA